MEEFERQHVYPVHGRLQYVDVAEVLGGEARTTNILRRRHYEVGRNFDCVAGVDLMRQEDEDELYEYIMVYKPFVLAMAPQCKGMAGWGRFNAKMNPVAHKRSVAVSLHLGRICAHCAYLQIKAGRHLFCEQPRGSDLYRMDEWRKLCDLYPVVWCIMHMCMVGLVSSRGKLLMKPSELWASSEYLLYHFRRMYCDHSHEHDTIEGGSQAPHKFGLGSLLGASPTASKTSFVHMFMQYVVRCTQQPRDDRNFRAQFPRRRLIPIILAIVGAAGRAAMVFNERISDTRGIRMDASGR